MVLIGTPLCCSCLQFSAPVITRRVADQQDRGPGHRAGHRPGRGAAAAAGHRREAPRRARYRAVSRDPWPPPCGPPHPERLPGRLHRGERTAGRRHRGRGGLVRAARRDLHRSTDHRHRSGPVPHRAVRHPGRGAQLDRRGPGLGRPRRLGRRRAAWHSSPGTAASRRTARSRTARRPHGTLDGLTLDVDAGEFVGVVAARRATPTRSSLLSGQLRPAIRRRVRSAASLEDLDRADARRALLVEPHEPTCSPARWDRTSRRAPRRARRGVDAALRASGAIEVVDVHRDGLDHAVTERGASLSGGQRQRLTLARALLRRPPSWSCTNRRPPSTRSPRAPSPRASARCGTAPAQLHHRGHDQQSRAAGGRRPRGASRRRPRRRHGIARRADGPRRLPRGGVAMTRPD